MATEDAICAFLGCHELRISNYLFISEANAVAFAKSLHSESNKALFCQDTSWNYV